MPHTQPCTNDLPLGLPEGGVQIGTTDTGYAIMLHPDGVRLRQQAINPADLYRRRERTYWFVAITAFLLACLAMFGFLWLAVARLPAGRAPTATSMPTATLLLPTATPAPTATQAVPVPPTAMPPPPTTAPTLIGILKVTANERSCPSLSCEIVGRRPAGSLVVISSYSEGRDWACLTSGSWIYSALLEVPQAN